MGPASTPALGKQDKTEIHMTWWGSQARHDRTIAVIELFEQQNPNIDIVYEFSGWGDYWTLMTTKATGGELPDVMQHDYAFMYDWQSNDLLMPMDPYFEDGTIDISSISEDILATGKIDGQQYGFPLATNSQAILIDVDAFEAAGIELPPTDWTWAQFEETATALHDALGIWGFGGTLSDEALWKSLLIGNGEWAFNEDGTAFGYDDDQPVVDYFNMILRLIDAEVLPSAAQWAEFAALGPEGNPLVTGQAAMGYWWSNQVVAISNAAGPDRHFRLWPLPRPEGGQPENYVKPSMFFAIPATADHPLEAAQFINFFINSPEANDILGPERGVPVSTVIRDYLAPSLDAINAETFSFLELVETDASPVPPPDPTGWADIRDNVYTPLFVDPVLYGEISPEEGVQILRDEAEIILSENAE
jgi:multiple sugar transport system substrate-binding protein